ARPAVGIDERNLTFPPAVPERRPSCGVGVCRVDRGTTAGGVRAERLATRAGEQASCGGIAIDDAPVEVGDDGSVIDHGEDEREVTRLVGVALVRSRCT